MSSHITMLNNPGESSLSKQPTPEFSDVDFPPGWQGLTLEDSGVFMFMFNISPRADEFPIHVSEDEWLAYVVSGSGTLYAGTADMQKTDDMAYEAGDFITFAADTPHGWLNGSEKSRILFVKRA